jgi:hypothetical protein
MFESITGGENGESGVFQFFIWELRVDIYCPILGRRETPSEATRMAEQYFGHSAY